MSMNGIDVASYQTGIDLSVVPCDFVIIKATEGNYYTNPDFARAYDQAIAQGKKVGIYHYANGIVSAETEAAYFLDTVGDRVGEAILVLDWEQGGNNAFGNPAYAKTWLDYVFQKTGVRAIIYMSKSVCYGYDWSAVAPNHGLWVAQYADNNPTGYQTNPWTDANGYGAWSAPAIFQYSSTGRLAGWNGNLDLNIAYMDGTAWDKYAQGENYKAPEPAEEPTAHEKEIRKVINKMEQEETYNTLDELPFGRDIIAKLIEKGLISGVDDEGNLGISYDLLRVLVINYRAGVYGE